MRALQVLAQMSKSAQEPHGKSKILPEPSLDVGKVKQPSAWGETRKFQQLGANASAVKPQPDPAQVIGQVKPSVDKSPKPWTHPLRADGSFNPEGIKLWFNPSDENKYRPYDLDSQLIIDPEDKINKSKFYPSARWDQDYKDYRDYSTAKGEGGRQNALYRLMMRHAVHDPAFLDSIKNMRRPSFYYNVPRYAYNGTPLPEMIKNQEKNYYTAQRDRNHYLTMGAVDAVNKVTAPGMQSVWNLHPKANTDPGKDIDNVALSYNPQATNNRTYHFYQLPKHPSTIFNEIVRQDQDIKKPFSSWPDDPKTTARFRQYYFSDAIDPSVSSSTDSTTFYPHKSINKYVLDELARRAEYSPEKLKAHIAETERRLNKQLAEIYAAKNIKGQSKP